MESYFCHGIRIYKTQLWLFNSQFWLLNNFIMYKFIFHSSGFFFSEFWAYISKFSFLIPQFKSHNSDFFSLKILNLHLKILIEFLQNSVVQFCNSDFFQNFLFKSHILYFILRIQSLRLTILSFFQNSHQFKSHNSVFPSAFWIFTSYSSDFVSHNFEFISHNSIK